MVDAQQPDPALLAEGEADEAAELDQFRLREVVVQRLPGRVVQVEAPCDGLGVPERRLLPVVVPLRLLEVQQIVVVLLLQARRRGLQ